MKVQPEPSYGLDLSTKSAPALTTSSEKIGPIVESNDGPSKNKPRMFTLDLG